MTVTFSKFSHMMVDTLRPQLQDPFPPSTPLKNDQNKCSQSFSTLFTSSFSKVFVFTYPHKCVFKILLRPQRHRFQRAQFSSEPTFETVFESPRFHRPFLGVLVTMTGENAAKSKRFNALVWMRPTANRVKKAAF